MSELALYWWCVAGAAGGFVLNINAADYAGIGSVLEKYGIVLRPGWLLLGDVAFYALFGPLLVIGMYEPRVTLQAITLGLGWPFVVRGVITTVTSKQRRISSSASPATKKLPDGGAN
ncbi:hypothetical protein ELG72_33330 (plasmid) [Rhizobium leguminosarum]|uniref:hypothetical protein n=1 Tax=Rhizobium leguminosarum TaxID=384 RepID=UPI0010313CC5|nr:hypothetical protein [Rhizobium leguminosarum]TBF43453.1 hypothetical protein ELG91_35085 [Rhizobium leguminosarum]TBF46251.1 hypothetical protein ELG87_33785 [Rhizobium leguminosarum]TBF47668.1 hypothetical protein ELG90_31340 [Rhizobium leguminosarum]TBF65143.1 hypothetical protein ELG84_34310 [Rhizobium leguminosarum]TBF67324.1 hypothetical protein ELG89_30205 [Rhizobium leguminosarum]